LTPISINAIAGDRQAFMARPKLGTDWPGRSGAGCKNTSIQAFLTAAAVNSKRLAKALATIFVGLFGFLFAVLCEFGMDSKAGSSTTVHDPLRCLSGMMQVEYDLVQQPHATALPGGAEYLGDRRFQSFMASEITSLMPRRVSERRNSVQNGSASLLPIVRSSTSRRPSVLTAMATITATETIW